VSSDEWVRFVDGVAKLALEHAGSDATRWCDIVRHVRSLPSAHRETLMGSLESIINTTRWMTDERYAVWEVLRTTIDRLERAPSGHAMPAEELDRMRAIAASVEPGGDPRRHARLFDWRKWGQARAGDQRLRERQRAAVADVMANGIDELRLLTLEVKIPWEVGTLAAGHSDAGLDPAILAWLDSEEGNLRQAAIAFSRARLRQLGMDWLWSLLSASDVTSDRARASLMAAVPAAREYWSQISSLDEQLVAAYWRHLNVYDVSPDEYEDAVEGLVGQNLGWAAVDLLTAALHQQARPDVELVKSALRAVLATGRAGNHSYEVESLLGYLEEVAPDDLELARFEFWFFDFLDEHQPSGALYRALARDPDEFVSLVTRVFRAEGEARRQLTADERGSAHIAFSVLWNWPTVPGLRPDGSIDSELLQEWTRAVRLALADRGRAAVGDEVIGGVLSASPVGSDGIWPAESVRELIEAIGSSRLDAGLQNGLINRRGITSRAVYDGGDQERDLASRYRDMAVRASRQWRRTARVLRTVADWYREDARRNDLHAEQLADGG
jgi:hypothetical protein